MTDKPKLYPPEFKDALRYNEALKFDIEENERLKEIFGVKHPPHPDTKEP